MNFMIFLSFLVLAVNAQDPNSYLRAANLNVDIRYKEEWVELCSVHARVRDSGFKSRSDTKTCTSTKNDGILETYVRQNSQWGCSWSTDSYTANTNLDFYRKIKSKYQDAMSLALKENDKYAYDTIREEETLHELRVKTDKHTASLRATATSRAYWGPGGKCDLTLMGRIRRLDI